MPLSSGNPVARPILFETTTYSAVANMFIPPVLATDVFCIIGSSTKTIKILKITVNGTTTSGSPIKVTFSLVKRSTANTGGVAVYDTSVPHDSIGLSASATVKHYTANPVLGTPVGIVRANSTSIQNIGIQGTVEWIFEEGRHIILRGISEQLSVNLNATSITGPLLSITVEWVEY